MFSEDKIMLLIFNVVPIESINKINNNPIFRHGYVFRNESLLLFYCFGVDFYFMGHCQSLIKQWGSLWRCSIQELPRYFIALCEQWWRKQTHWWQKHNGVSPLVVWSGNRSRRSFSPRSECGMEWKLGTASSSKIGKNIYDWDETCEACFIHVTVTNSRSFHYSCTVNNIYIVNKSSPYRESHCILSLGWNSHKYFDLLNITSETVRSNQGSCTTFIWFV